MRRGFCGEFHSRTWLSLSPASSPSCYSHHAPSPAVLKQHSLPLHSSRSAAQTPLAILPANSASALERFLDLRPPKSTLLNSLIDLILPPRTSANSHILHLNAFSVSRRVSSGLVGLTFCLETKWTTAGRRRRRHRAGRSLLSNASSISISLSLPRTG